MLTPTTTIVLAVLALLALIVPSLLTYILVRCSQPGRIAVGSADAELRPVDPRATDRFQCKTCKHFDLEEGQAFFDRYPVAKEAYRHIHPSDEARADPSSVPLKARWEEFGACLVLRSVVWGGMVPAQRLSAKKKTRQAEDGKEVVVAEPFCPTGVDCYER